MLNSWSNPRSNTLTVTQCLAAVGSVFAAASLLLLVSAQWLQWVPLVRLALFGGAVAIMPASKSLRPFLLFSVLAMALILYVLRASGAIDQGDLLLRAAWETLGIGVVFLVTALIAKSASFKALPTLETHTPVKRACPIGALLWLLIVVTVFGVTHWRDQAGFEPSCISMGKKIKPLHGYA